MLALWTISTVVDLEPFLAFPIWRDPHKRLRWIRLHELSCISISFPYTPTTSPLKFWNGTATWLSSYRSLGLICGDCILVDFWWGSPLNLLSFSWMIIFMILFIILLHSDSSLNFLLLSFVLVLCFILSSIYSPIFRMPSRITDFDVGSIMFSFGFGSFIQWDSIFPFGPYEYLILS